LQITSYEEIKIAVAIVVDASTPGTPTFVDLNEACLFRDIRERSVPVVSVEDILAPIGHEQVIEALVVAISNRHHPSVGTKTNAFVESRRLQIIRT